MRLEKIKARAFLTYESLEYDFINKPLLVQGRNLTDDGQDSNGSGKSGLQTIIEFCITASSSRGVRDNELVSYGEKEAGAELIASCDVRKERIHIDWTIKVKGSNKLTLTKQKYDGSWEEVSFSNLNDGKKWIINWFDISKEDLFNYFIINKSRFKSFFGSSNKEKVDLINRFSDASIIEGLEDIDTELLESQLAEKRTEIIQIQTRIDVKNEEIIIERERDYQEEYEEIVEDIDCDISKLKSKIDLEGDVISSYKDQTKDLFLYNKRYGLQIGDDAKILLDLERDLELHVEKTKSIEVSVNEAQKLVDEFKGLDKTFEKEQLKSAIEEDADGLKKLEDSTDQLLNKKELILSIIQKVNVKLSGSITCPSCQHEFILDGDIEELEKKGEDAEALIKKVEVKIASQKAASKILAEQIDAFYESIKELKLEEDESLEGKSILFVELDDIRVQLSNHEARGRRIRREIEDESRSIREMEDTIKSNNSKVKIIEDCKKSSRDLINKYKKDIKDLESKRSVIKLSNGSDAISLLESSIVRAEHARKSVEKKVQVIGDEIYRLNQWKVNFKKFRLHLANQSLETIEYHSNRYLTEMGTDLKIILEGSKVLANGSIKDEITCKIFRGLERTFSSFSGGEKGRLLFASILANRFMINSTHKYGGLDFLSIDEVFEGVDASGLKSLIKSARDLEIAVMIITHVTDENVSDDTLMIEKVNGISLIKK